VVLCGTNRMGYNIGSVAFITAVMAYGVVLAMYNIAQERKERAALFVLGLPIAPQDYVRAKLLGTVLAFLLPWTVLTAVAVVVILTSRIPDGLLPFTLLVLVYFVCTFSAMAAVALMVNCDAKITVAITCTNRSVTIFMFGAGQLPGVGGGEMRATTMIWSPWFFVILAAELAVIALSFAVPLFYYSRKRDFL